MISLSMVARETLRLMHREFQSIGCDVLPSDRPFAYQRHVDVRLEPELLSANSLEDLSERLLAPIASNLAGNIAASDNGWVVRLHRIDAIAIPHMVESASHRFDGIPLTVSKVREPDGEYLRFDIGFSTRALAAA